LQHKQNKWINRKSGAGENDVRGGGLRILVTGGAGFIGSHLVHRLALEGYRSITVLDNLNRGLAANLSGVRGSVRFVEGDIRSQATVAGLMRNIDVVFHLAAQSNVLGAIVDVGYSSSTNIVGTAVVLEAVRASGVRRVVFTSSREVYGDPAALPVGENAPLRPKNAYGMSKVAGEMCCAMSEHTLETVILRLTNVYGTRDRGRVIPLFIDNALSGRPLVLYGGGQTIDFVHVDDVVEALMAVGFGPWVPGPLNIGSGTGTTVGELAERILKIANSDSVISLASVRQAEVVRFVADVSKARDRLGLVPRADALDGLAEMVAEAARPLESLLPHTGFMARSASV
jgi:UDP-glucose 4-epimerase